MFPDTLQHTLETRFEMRIQRVEAVGGGDIHEAARLALADGRFLFVKYNAKKGASDMFRTEAQGLALLGASQTIRTPRTQGHGTDAEGRWAFLLMEYVAPGPKNRLFWERFGEALANLHGNTSAQFGFAHDNFIGSLPQSNRRHDTWQDFYTNERLTPQMRAARDAGLLGAEDSRRMDRLCARLDEICPSEAPALTHGDLWGGNFLCDAMQFPVLIDPAAAFAQREMDLAMSRLFGGFDAAFYTAYEANWPLEPGFESRMDVYQLYYILVHVNLFGGAYSEQARNILRRF